MKKLGLSVLILMCAGCSNPEWTNSWNSCLEILNKEMPAVYTSETVEELRSISVPTSSCDNNQCTNSTKREYYSVPVIKTVEVNRVERLDANRKCTIKKCRELGLNSQCKAE